MHFTFSFVSTFQVGVMRAARRARGRISYSQQKQKSRRKSHSILKIKRENVWPYIVVLGIPSHTVITVPQLHAVPLS